MTNPDPGHYHAEGDPPDTVRYWNGTAWEGDPMPAPPSDTPPPPPPGAGAPPPPPGAGAPPPVNGGVDTSRFATLGIRIGAGLIDALISVILAAILVGVLWGSSTGDGGFVATADAGQSILTSLIFWAIFLAILASQSATPGKLMLGLLVTKEDGHTRIDLQTAFMRSLPGLVGVIPVLNILVGLVMLIGSIIGIANDSERRSLYDRIGKTRVVYKNRL